MIKRVVMFFIIAALFRTQCRADDMDVNQLTALARQSQAVANGISKTAHATWIFSPQTMRDRDGKLSAGRFVYFDGEVEDFQNDESGCTIQFSSAYGEDAHYPVIGSFFKHLQRSDFVSETHGPYSLYVIGKVIKTINTGTEMNPYWVTVVKICAMRVGSKLFKNEAMIKSFSH